MQKEHQLRAILAFGDVEGFGSFTQRVSFPDTEFLPFIREFDRIIDEFEDETGYFVKRLGDGFMCVVEVPEPVQQNTVTHVIDACWKLTSKIHRLIAKKRTPRPEGFRTRMVCGYVWKTIRSHNREDYLGYHANLCEKILHINKKDTFVCHESIKELIPERTARAKGFRFKKMTISEAVPDGVYREDIKALWTMTKRK